MVKLMLDGRPFENRLRSACDAPTEVKESRT
jgi:hypothetical protein